MILLRIFLCIVGIVCSENPEKKVGEFDWSFWWGYDGISGPGFWGVINRHWRLCSDGMRQSPIDLATEAFVFDHNLKEIQVDSHEVDGSLSNTGFGLKWTPSDKKEDTTSVAPGPVETQERSTYMLSGGSLHYKYQLSFVSIRWSVADKGSEHLLQGQNFPAEVQLVFYNSDLYTNYTEAENKPNGVAAVSVLVKVGWKSNPVLKIWMDHLHLVPHRDRSTWTPFVPLKELFTSGSFLTYEGSLTEPPCEETVTWIILNKPAYITADQLYQLQSIRRGAQGQSSLSAGNIRPPQPLHSRVIRTNISPHRVLCSKHNNTDSYKALDLGTS